MARRLEKTLKIAVFFLLWTPLLVTAEVKLRIYLKDGSLQAGNMIADNTTSFVLLTKEGRVEIPKENIMFVNGKSLQQWEARPDKLYQTEIIPSEIPDPSYVHDKAALPQPPKAAPNLEPVTPLKEVLQKSEEKKLEPLTQAPAIEPKKVEEKQPVQPVKAVPEKEAVPEPLLKPKKPVVIPKKEKKPKLVETPAKPPEPERASMTLMEAPLSRPKQFSRVGYADYHFQKAQSLLKQGYEGRAIQELHIATILDRQNEKASLLLGRLYQKHGVFTRAKKYLEHPALKKKDEVRQMVKEMDDAVKKAVLQKRILWASTAAGVLVSFPLLMLVRRFSPKQPKSTVVTADTVTSLMENLSTRLPEEETEKEEEPAAAVEEAKPKEEEKDVEPWPFPFPASEIPVTKAPPQPIPLAVAGENKADMESALLKAQEVQKALEAVKQEVRQIEAPVEQPPEPAVVASVEEMAIVIPPSLPEPEPEPAPEPVKTPVEMEHAQILKMGTRVMEEVQKGHEFVSSGQFEPARRAYGTALALDPGCVEAHMGLGYICFAEGQYDRAIGYYERALKIAPRSADAHYALGRLLLETGHIEEGILKLQACLRLDPTLFEAQETLAALGRAA